MREYSAAHCPLWTALTKRRSGELLYDQEKFKQAIERFDQAIEKDKNK